MSKHNPLQELHRCGVSVWYDNISRGLLNSGELARLIKQDGIRGVTSNPTIFEKAIGSSHDYDEAIRRLAAKGRPSQEIFESLAVDDIRAAADLFSDLYEDTKGADGYVSLELPPALARDAEGSHEEALRLFKRVDRPNVMIKIPGTVEGVAAFERATADGVPVNVTLLFSQQRYAEVVEAYLRGLETRAKRKKKLSAIASVASFFVSRVDTTIDQALEANGSAAARALLGKAAIANAKLAYQHYKKEFESARFSKLRKAGARAQRLLWASTGTKNPAYRDVVYVEELIGDNTVNTMPPATVDAFRDHGACHPSLEEDVTQARENWTALKQFGIDTDAVASRLEREGLDAFAKSFETLLGQIAAKREIIEAESGVVDVGLTRLENSLFSSRLWNKDASLWKKAADHQKIIKNSLGWLVVPEAMAAGLGAVRGFVREVQADGFTDAVVLGMGGSSLACEVFRRCFSSAPGFLRLHVLDSTNPATVAELTRQLDLARTLFIVASKSGSTIEPNCFMEHFFAAAQKVSGTKAGRQFVAVTDPGTSLDKLARQRGFRKVFINPSDIGGRFSALSLFGLVPAALMGIDVEKLLDRARQAARQCAASVPTRDNPGLRLGAALGRHAARGQDKLTLRLSAGIESFGLWIEQLIAESTGKEGKGITPVFGESGAPSKAAAGDRVFINVEVQGQPIADQAALTLKLADVYDLGAQFFIWEVATAAAGFFLNVNPFDQPDVQAAKDQTKALLTRLQKGKLPAETADLTAGGMAGFCDEALLKILAPGSRAPNKPLNEVLAAHWSRLKAGDYGVILAYVNANEDTARSLEELRRRLSKQTSVPVMLEYGPRYLHSTGQLYKGGPDSGLFLMIVEPDGATVPIPGEPFNFGTLHRAQARGDFAALLERGRRALRLELGLPGSNSLQALLNAAASAQCPH